MEARDPGDYVSQLADELALRILWYLDGKEILQVAQTCRRWRQLAEDEGLWQGKCKARGIEEPLCITRRKAKASRSGPWKSSYIRQLRIDTNWRLGRFQTTRLDINEENLCMEHWKFNGKELVITSQYNMIKIWSAVTGECLRTLVGHTHNITAMAMRDHIIISGSADGTIKVWNGESGESLHTLCGHIDPVSCVFIHERRVESGSRDGSIRIWDMETGECLHVLMVDVEYIKYIHYDGQRVVSVNGRYSCTLNIWDPDTPSCLVTFPLPGTDRIHHSELKGSRLLLVTDNGEINVWDTETREPIRIIGDLYKYIITVSETINLHLWGEKALSAGFNQKTIQRDAENARLRRNFVISDAGFGPVPLGGFEPNTFFDVKEKIYSFHFKKSLEPLSYVMVSPTKVICVIGGKYGKVQVRVLDFSDWGKRKRFKL
ncbi:hypothetical protein XELAEV_18021699mg [Xenopus laevis]|nr:hypothetical protein XELAEV_18021699mg [Xenopus laevis]